MWQHEGLLAEYHETIEELRLEYLSQPSVAWADALAESATFVFPSDRATGATPDPDDEVILECTLAGEVDMIVTGDKKHLLPLRRYRDVAIVSPTDFLRRVGG